MFLLKICIKEIILNSDVGNLIYSFILYVTLLDILKCLCFKNCSYILHNISFFLFIGEYNHVLVCFNFVEKGGGILKALFMSIILRNPSLSNARGFYSNIREIGKGNVYLTEN